MDKDRIKGKGKELKGHAQEAYGKMTGQPSHQIKGKAEQAEGKVQQGFGKVKDELRDQNQQPGRDVD